MTKFWDEEITTVEILRKRAHKAMLEVVCQHIAMTADKEQRQITLDAVLMYMTIDLGPNMPRAAVKEAIKSRVVALVEDLAAPTAK